MVVNQIRVAWTGVKGLPGVTTFYSEHPPADFIEPLKTFFGAIKQFHPTGLTWTIPHNGKTIDLATGHANGTWSAAGADDQVGGTTSSTYAAPVGYCINWHTGAFVGGREVVGRTFMVPAVAGAFSNDGSLETPNLAIMRTAATTLASSGVLAVYSRKGSSVATVTGGVVPDEAVVLRSRRD